MRVVFGHRRHRGRPLITVSGTPYVPGRASTEADPLPTSGPVGGRSRSVTAVLDLASHGVRQRWPSACRAHGPQRGQGRIACLPTDMARRTGVSGYPGDGTATRCCRATRSTKLAVLFRLVLEKASAGTAWHAVSDQGDAVRQDIATVIGSTAGAPGRSGTAGNFRPARPDLRDRPALGEHPHPAGTPARGSHVS